MKNNNSNQTQEIKPTQDNSSTQTQDKLTKTIVVSKTVKVKTKKGTRTTIANKTVREEKIVELDNFTILPTGEVNPNIQFVTVLLRRDVLNTMFYNNYCTKEETERKLAELDVCYTEKLYALKSTLIATDTEEKEKNLLIHTQIKRDKILKGGLFKDHVSNNKAILIFSYLCFCREIKGNEEIILKAGRKTKEEEKTIKVNNNSILRIDLKEMISSLSLSLLPASIKEVKEIFTAFEELGILKFKEYNNRENIYDIILVDDIFNYKFIFNKNKETDSENISDIGFVKLSMKEFGKIKKAESNSSTKFYSLLSLYLGIKETSPMKMSSKNSEALFSYTSKMTEEEFKKANKLDLNTGIRSISFEELNHKINLSEILISNIIKTLEKEKILKVNRGRFNTATKTRPQNTYEFLP